MRNGMRVGVVGALLLGGLHAWGQAPDLQHMDLVEKSVPDGPVAKVRGANISAHEFLGLYRGIVAPQRSGESETPPSDAERLAIAMRCLGMLVEREILYQEALKRKIELSEEEIDKGLQIELDQMRKRVARAKGTEITEDELLQMAQASRTDARQELRKALLVERMMALLAKEKGVAVTDEDVRAFFEANRERLRKADTCHLKQIFVRAPVGRSDGEAKRKEARTKTENALKRIRAGESFEAVARSTSDPPFDQNGGDLGPKPVGEAPGALPDFLVKAANALQAGQISDVIESEFGFHVVQLVEMTPGKEPALETTKEFIRNRLLSQRADKASKDFCRAVIDKKGQVEVYLELGKTLMTHPDEELRKQFLASPGAEGAESK